MKIVNLTNQELVFLSSSLERTYPSPGYSKVPVVRHWGDQRVPVEKLDVRGIPVGVYDEAPNPSVDYLPDPEPGTYYIVEDAVRRVCPKRTDLYSAVGDVTGGKQFVVYLVRNPNPKQVLPDMIVSFLR